MSIVDIETIGTGGGSIAWLDKGAVRVGPHSAGSIPGPACYGRGGTQPTVTDANLFLGRLGAKSLLGGDMSLDEAAATKAIDTLAAEAGLDSVAFAEGILAISNAAMADAMRTITVSQGVDPREFALVAFGGAGPMAAAFLAGELGHPRGADSTLPRNLFGLGHAADRSPARFHPQLFPGGSGRRTGIRCADVYEQLEEEGHQAIVAEGIAEDRVSFQRSADMRYLGQEYTINVPVSELAIDRISEAFHAAHDRRYGHASPGAPIEFVNLRLAAFGAIDKFQGDTTAERDDSDPVIGEREIVFDGDRHRTPIVARDRLPPDYAATGPLIVEEQSATTVVPPGWSVSIDREGSIVLRQEAVQ